LRDPSYVVGIVVDPAFGDRLHEILRRMPVWIAGTDANRRTAESAWIDGPRVEFTEPGGLTTFRINPHGTPEDWFEDVLGKVAGHHDRYSHVP